MVCIDLGQMILSILIFWGAIFIITLAYVWVKDWWLYSPSAQRLQCRIWGHDYHNGAAQNLKVTIDGDKYIYDFCQRCHTEQNKREATLGELTG